MKSPLPCLIATLTLSLWASPADAHSGRYTPAPSGTVLVENHAGVPVSVTVEGSEPRALGAWESAYFPARAGEVDVRATYRQYGTSFTLARRELRVKTGRTSRVELVPPGLGKVKFVNDSGAETSVLVNGRELAQLAPGDSRLVTVPLGRNEVVVLAHGVQLESEHLDVRPFSESTVVARAPAFADLVVTNPLPFAVDVSLARGGERRVAAYSSTVFAHVAVGRTEVTSKRLGGYLVDTETVTVRPWAGAEMAVDTPRTGLVTLDSDAGELLRVFVDGRLVSMVEPYAEATLLLPTGPTVVEVRQLDGGLVERSYLTVDALRTAALEFGHACRGGHHHGERDHDRGRGDDHDEGEERRHIPATW